MRDETLEGLFESIGRLVQENTAPEVQKTKTRRQQLEELFGDPDMDEELDEPDEQGAWAKRQAEKIRTLTTPGITRRRPPPGLRIRAITRPAPPFKVEQRQETGRPQGASAATPATPVAAIAAARAARRDETTGIEIQPFRQRPAQGQTYLAKIQNRPGRRAMDSPV